MSSSKIKVFIKRPSEQGEVELINTQFRVIARGFGSISTELEPGIYQARTRVGGTTVDELFQVEPDSLPLEVNLKAVAFPSPIPLEDTSTSHEYHQAAIHQALQNIYMSEGQNAQIMICLRDLSDLRYQQMTKSSELQNKYQTSFKGFRLLDPSGKVALDLDAIAMHNLTQGITTIGAAVIPGNYVLEYAPIGMEPVCMPLHTVAGWQTQFFLTLNQPHGLNASDVANLIDRSVTMHQIGSFFNPNDPNLRLSEKARYALSGTQWSSITKDQFHLLLKHKFTNPVLGLFAGHIILRWEKPDWELLQLVIRNVADMIGNDFPDVVALRMAVASLDQGSWPEEEVSFPPLLSASWDELMKNPDLLENPVLRKVALGLTISDPWLTWKPTVTVDWSPVAVNILSHFPAQEVFKKVPHVARFFLSPSPPPRDGVLISTEDGSEEPSEENVAWRMICQLVKEVDWDDLFAHLTGEEEKALSIQAPLSDLQKALLPTLHYISQLLNADKKFTIQDFKQLQGTLQIPLTILIDSLKDLINKIFIIYPKLQLSENTEPVWLFNNNYREEYGVAAEEYREPTEGFD